MFEFLEPPTLHLLWFSILGVLLAGYAMLDGFDLGVGTLHPFITQDEQERRIVMNCIGPLWDGNEVWLVTFGGALFAMFPEAYATICSGLYIPFMLILFSLIFRAVSLEFRGKVASPSWRTVWDWAFFCSSTLATVLFGIAVGTVLQGLPLDERGSSLAPTLSIITPFSLLIGVLSLASFTLHGSLFLEMKTTGELQARIQKVMWRCYGLFLVAYLFATLGTVALEEELLSNLRSYPVLWFLPAFHILVVANIPRCIYHGWYRQAFLMSCFNLLSLVGLLGAQLFPYMIRPVSGGKGMLISSATSSPPTLRLGLLVVVIGMPLVLAYTGIVYWAFRGKVQLDEHSY